MRSGSTLLFETAAGIRQPAGKAVVLAFSILAGWPSLSGASPTFTKDVAPILYKNCSQCHRPNEVAPMSLMTYDEVRP